MVALTGDEELRLRELTKRITELYPKVKTHIIASEKRDKGHRLSIPAINELRNAFDHMMRVRAVIDLEDMRGPTRAELSPFDYCKVNIDKALGHVYRAGYDAFDVLSLSLADDINRKTNDYRMSTLVAVFNDFHKEVQSPLNKALITCDEAKAEKDVESPSAQYTTYSKYENAIGELQRISKLLSEKQEVLQKFESEENQKVLNQQNHFRNQRNIAIGALILSIILYIISFVV